MKMVPQYPQEQIVGLEQFKRKKLRREMIFGAKQTASPAQANFYAKV